MISSSNISPARGLTVTSFLGKVIAAGDNSPADSDHQWLVGSRDCGWLAPQVDET